MQWSSGSRARFHVSRTVASARYSRIVTCHEVSRHKVMMAEEKARVTKKPADRKSGHHGGHIHPRPSLGSSQVCCAARRPRTASETQTDFPEARPGQLRTAGPSWRHLKPWSGPRFPQPLLWTVSQAPQPVLQGHGHADATLMGVPTGAHHYPAEAPALPARVSENGLTEVHMCL